jgi:hypothetical protein
LNECHRRKEEHQPPPTVKILPHSYALTLSLPSSIKYFFLWLASPANELQQEATPGIYTYCLSAIKQRSEMGSNGGLDYVLLKID